MTEKEARSSAKQGLNGTIESREKLFECEICGVDFTYLSYLKRHMIIHLGSKPFKCTTCDKTFKTKNEVKIHVAAVHDKEKTFECDYCDKKF